MFGTLSIPESVEYLYTTFVRDYRGYYSQDQFTYREDPTRAMERSMINFANLALKAVRDLAAAAARSTWRAPPGTGPDVLDVVVAGAGRMNRAAFTIGIDYGTNSVRAVVVDCADGRVRRHERLRLSERRRRACCSHPRDPHLARQNPADYIEGLRAVGRPARWPQADRDAGVLARSRDRHRRRHHRLDAAARRRAAPAARARSALAGQPRRARLAVEGPHRRRRGGGDHRDRARSTRPILSRRSAARIRPSGGGRRSGTA